MHIVPVLDLKGGRVVRAAGGQRANYSPWISSICPDAQPVQAVASLLRLFPFPAIYLADLDGIEGRVCQTDLVAELAVRFVETEFWTDNGAPRQAEFDDWRARRLGRLVAGSESFGAGPLPALDGHVLSLDFKHGRFLGPPELLAGGVPWPRDVIIMSLDQVGAEAGPDLARLKALRVNAGGSRLYAAGGVRHAGDLAELHAAGVHGALLATALHNGSLDRAAIAGFITM
jgi:uncharacterized protein related to proFAR isomerase